MVDDRIMAEVAGGAALSGDAGPALADAPALGDAPVLADADAEGIAAILEATYSAENHESLDAGIMRLMLDLSKEEVERLDEAGEERLWRVVRAVLLALRR